MVGNGEIGSEDKKLKKIRAVSKPQNRKELRKFLGLIGYYRKFIENFSEIAAPLTDMTKNSRSKVLQWTETTTAAFEKLKEKMSSAPVLKLPKLGERFTIRTDASGNGLGAVLMQESEDVTEVVSTERCRDGLLVWRCIQSYRDGLPG
ncbi:uncharacterized mitochondrial protein AtMg00860-like [Gigantopelta aegis]|uniref:uncharacterized mitochondrial protein AtMg00860-like n=1 Tax=Gigantopelta aegis TaxID=1735272 RepID=UPI001B888B04|nr:uncharacterized mitochondrial protein AtMg00860-like [Gigantopelta aegis]